MSDRYLSIDTRYIWPYLPMFLYRHGHTYLVCRYRYMIGMALPTLVHVRHGHIYLVSTQCLSDSCIHVRTYDALDIG